MSTVDLPEAVLERLAAAAAERGVSADELAAEILAERFGPPDENSGSDVLAMFIGSAETGDADWAGTDTVELRKAVDSRRSA